ncbi:uncharacterized protein LOC21404418 [Morus notabilis]|uniref:uncharacterized protein LOC21404418 n=1 Tax=Morus notabilis TaxID=981085 RepID=UPI000CED6D7B|nr:uncharacterized protein LOC21404418 [Morus notabilis]
MDSGNSGSMSSSGDEEYDSRNESIPSFLNPSSSSSISTHHFASSAQSNPSHLLSHHLFDLSPPSNYLQPNSNPSNFLLNLRSDGLRSDHHHHQQQPYQLGPPTSSSYAAGPSAIHLQQQQQPSSSLHNEANTTTTGALRSGNTSTAAATTSSAQTTVVRNSKKRARASRRAPTTVLTTDTSNFRAMVQEFTGIPAPPFSASSFSRRLDLFGGSGSAIRTGGASHLEGPFYPFRPSAQKPQTSPFGNIASSSSSSPLFSNVMVDATNIATSSLNFQPSPSDHHHHHHLISRQPRNMLNMQNPGVNNVAFQSLPLHPNSLNMTGFGAKRGQGNNLTVSTTTSALDNQEVNASYHRGGINSNLQVASDGTVVPLTRQDLWRIDGAGSGDSCKLNYAAAAAANPSEFQAEKGLEINVSTRNEGPYRNEHM